LLLSYSQIIFTGTPSIKIRGKCKGEKVVVALLGVEDERDIGRGEKTN
jgi:hypothetical protein